jgi:hypothetical protein
MSLTCSESYTCWCIIEIATRFKGARKPGIENTEGFLALAIWVQGISIKSMSSR